MIKYSNPDSRLLSFRGVGIFNDGKLHNAPFICINDDGYARLFSKMIDGRPADDSNYTYFYSNGFKQHVDQLNNQTDVSGWQAYSGQTDKERRGHGLAKRWQTDGSVFIG